MKDEFTYLPEKQAKEREQMVFGRDFDWKRYRYGGVSHFDNLPPIAARKLIQRGYLKREDCQNSSPSAEEIIDFCESFPAADWYLHGYAVSPARDDCRITIEGCGTDGPVEDPSTIITFAKFFRYADELTAGLDSPLYCWYD